MGGEGGENVETFVSERAIGGGGVVGDRGGRELGSKEPDARKCKFIFKRNSVYN